MSYPVIILSRNYLPFSIFLSVRFVSTFLATLLNREKRKKRVEYSRIFAIIDNNSPNGRLSLVISTVRDRNAPISGQLSTIFLQNSAAVSVLRRISTKLQPCRREFAVILILISFDVSRMPDRPPILRITVFLTYHDPMKGHIRPVNVPLHVYSSIDPSLKIVRCSFFPIQTLLRETYFLSYNYFHPIEIFSSCVIYLLSLFIFASIDRISYQRHETIKSYKLSYQCDPN